MDGPRLGMVSEQRDKDGFGAGDRMGKQVLEKILVAEDVAVPLADRG